MLEIDDLTVWMGEPYVINDKIVVYQPTVREVLRFGECQYYSMVQAICSTSSNKKSQLADSGLD